MVKPEWINGIDYGDNLIGLVFTDLTVSAFHLVVKWNILMQNMVYNDMQ